MAYNMSHVLPHLLSIMSTPKGWREMDETCDGGRSPRDG
jgi:hypothetical protein